MKRFGATVVSTVILFLVTGTARADSDETYRVYDAVIAHMFAGNKVTFDTREDVSQLVILERSVTEYASGDKQENWKQVKIRLPQLSDELVGAFESHLKTERKLKRSFHINLTYTFISPAVFEDLINSETMEKLTAFYGKYPGSGGAIAFSNVGFNKARDQALVYFVHWCRFLCGSGHYLILHKQGGKWKVAQATQIWTS